MIYVWIYDQGGFIIKDGLISLLNEGIIYKDFFAFLNILLNHLIIMELISRTEE